MSQTSAFEAMLSRGQDSDMLRFTLGSAYFAQGEHNTAITHLQKAVEMNPGYSAAWKILGRALAANQQAEEALQAFDNGLAAADSNGDKQTSKEISVFRRRVQKSIDNQEE